MGVDDYDWLSGIFDNSGGADTSNMDFWQLPEQQAGLDTSNPNFGMNDRGLGTQDPNMALPGQGTLSPGAIASLGTPATGNTNLSGLGSTTAGGTADILKALGGIPGLLSLLGPILGGVMASHASSSAAAQQQASAQKANDQATALMGGSGAAYKPYQDAGGAALGKLQGMNWAPLSGQFANPQANSLLGYQQQGKMLAPTMSSPGPGRMATLASLGGGH